MIKIIFKSLHWLILAYGVFVGYVRFESLVAEKTELERQQIDLNNDLALVEKKLEEVKRFAQDLENSKEQVNQVVEQIQKIQKQLPADISDGVIGTKLSEMALAIKMISPVPVPKTEKENEFYFSKEYNLDVQGTYLQAMIFFEKLEKASKEDRLLTVKYVRMKQSATGDKRSRFQVLDISTTIEAYRYNLNFINQGPKS